MLLTVEAALTINTMTALLRTVIEMMNHLIQVICCHVKDSMLKARKNFISGSNTSEIHMKRDFHLITDITIYKDQSQLSML